MQEFDDDALDQQSRVFALCPLRIINLPPERTLARGHRSTLRAVESVVASLENFTMSGGHLGLNQRFFGTGNFF